MNAEAQGIWDTLTVAQRNFAIARLRGFKIRQSAHLAGVNRATPVQWRNYEAINRCIDLMQQDELGTARLALQAAALEAVDALRDVIAGDQDSARVSAAIAILDRIGIPAVSRQEHSGVDGSPIIVNVHTNVNADAV